MNDFIPMTESDIYKDMKKARENSAIWSVAAIPLYDKWWHRLIPAKRRQAKKRQRLIEYLTKQQNYIDSFLEQMAHAFLKTGGKNG